MVSSPKVAVLGSGNAGISMAGILALSGVDVSLAELPDFESSLEPIVSKGGINVKGEFGVGLAKPTVITTDMKEAIRGRKILLFCHPAYAHEPFTRACAPYLEDGQILVYISYFGAMRMAKLLADLGVDADVTVGETLSFLYACDKVGPNEALLKRRKEGLPFAAFPATKTKAALEVLNRIFDDYTPARNCLETSINNVNPWAHPQGVILNAGWIEATKGAFSFYMEAMTPGVVRVQRACDCEKMEIAEKLGIEKVSTDELTKRFYAKVIQETGSTHQPKYYAKVHDAPKHLKHRYLVEDMLYGMVPVASIGHEIGVETPIMNACITIGSILAEMDFWNEGVTAKSLGLSGLTAAEMMAFADKGRV
ncbi:MAG: NAD/NADP octopine/nopaline dehydrogenase family protein [Armatimonadetes bacterium]|nr:NAD/NADP octopine/nopaline dehydrogenase family protein [Armatimonadota bacterium]